MKSILSTISLLVLIFFACKKESFITGSEAQLRTSEDSVHFDTVFTSTGSITRFFRVYNENNQKLRLSKLYLAGGLASAFKINADGIPGPEINNIEIDARDSIYVFVTVKIDPSQSDLPFVIQDSIGIEYNGNKHWVQLDAWGQNANFFRSRLISSNETWNSNKPYVILGGLQVDTNATLTIEKGTKIYLHADAPFIVDGTLKINGEKFDSTRVVFQGDRLDEPYRNFPGAWPGIYFRGESKDNELNYAIIKNAYQGLVSEKPSINSNPKLTLNECIIDNCFDIGVFGLRSNIKARNILVSNCGKNIVLAYGGSYDFNHCTSAAFSNSFILHKEPVLLVTDFIKQGNTLLTDNINAVFRNCIFWGDNGTVDDEVVASKQGNTSFLVNFQNCLWKVKNAPGNISSSNIVSNEAPLFDSVNNQKRLYNFRLKEESPARNKGLNSSVNIDLDGNPRPLGLPDIGCYEKQ